MPRKEVTGQMTLFEQQAAKTVAASSKRSRSVMRADSVATRRIFRREILPLIRHVSVIELSEATGLSYRYCASIKRGRVPSVRHWAKLRRLGERKLV